MWYVQVDTIDPVAGVTVLEGGRTIQGPKVIEVSNHLCKFIPLSIRLHTMQYIQGRWGTLNS